MPPASTNEKEDHLSYPGPLTPRSRCPGSTTISDMLPPTAEKSMKIPAELKSKGYMKRKTVITGDQNGNTKASERNHEPAISSCEEGDITKK